MVSILFDLMNPFSIKFFNSEFKFEIESDPKFKFWIDIKFKLETVNKI